MLSRLVKKEREEQHDHSITEEYVYYSADRGGPKEMTSHVIEGTSSVDENLTTDRLFQLPMPNSEIKTYHSC